MSVPSPRAARMAVPWVDARVVTVTADVAGSVVTPRWWPLMLDGILAAAARREALGADYWVDVDTPPRELLDADPHGTRHPQVKAYRDRQRTRPIGLATIAWGGPWWWTATCGDLGSDISDSRAHYKRFRAVKAERIVERLPANTDVGITKGWVLPYVATVTNQVRWRAIGNPDRIAELLDRVDQVGARRAAGEGRVLRWTVTDDGPATRDAVWQIVWDDDGLPARPVPHHRRVLQRLGLTAADQVGHTVRPPYLRAPFRGETRSRPLPTVIAPWTRRPQETTDAAA